MSTAVELQINVIKLAEALSEAIKVKLDPEPDTVAGCIAAAEQIILKLGDVLKEYATHNEFRAAIARELNLNKNISFEAGGAALKEIEGLMDKANLEEETKDFLKKFINHLNKKNQEKEKS